MTADARIASGYTVKQHVKHGECAGGSDVTIAYRCFATNRIYDPCQRRLPDIAGVDCATGGLLAVEWEGATLWATDA